MMSVKPAIAAGCGRLSGDRRSDRGMRRLWAVSPAPSASLRSCLWSRWFPGGVKAGAGGQIATGVGWRPETDSWTQGLIGGQNRAARPGFGRGDSGRRQWRCGLACNAKA